MSEVSQSCPTLCDPMDCSPPGSSIHGILQARILEWVAISFSRGSSRTRDQTQVSRIAGRHFKTLSHQGSPANCHMTQQIPLLSIHLKETRTERDTCTPMFIATLFTIARTWKQPRSPSADERIRKLWYIYTVEYYSAIKRNTFKSVLMR